MYNFNSASSYIQPPEYRKKHHVQVVEQELHKHPEEYPKIHPAEHPTPKEEEEEVKKFDKTYHLPEKKPPVLWYATLRGFNYSVVECYAIDLVGAFCELSLVEAIWYLLLYVNETLLKDLW